MIEGRPKLLRGVATGLLFGLGAGMAFLAAYLAAPAPEDEKIFVGTGVFMVAAVALMLLHRVPKRKLWPLPWTTMLVVIMGGLTLWWDEPAFIKMRPTVQFGAAAAFGAATLTTGWLPIKELERFDTIGRRKLKVVFITFGLSAAAANELVWRSSSTLFWLGYQMWGPIVIFALVFGAAYPMLANHFTTRDRTVTPA